MSYVRARKDTQKKAQAVGKAMKHDEEEPAQSWNPSPSLGQRLLADSITSTDSPLWNKSGGSEGSGGNSDGNGEGSSYQLGINFSLQ